MPRGGRREGAGRKPTLGVLAPITVRLTTADVKRLKRLIKRHEADGPTGAIRAALRVASAPVRAAPISDEERRASAEMLCKAIAAIGTGEDAEARGALAELGKAMGLSPGDKRRITGALKKARESRGDAGQAPAPGSNKPELSIADEAKRLRKRASRELKRHPMPVYDEYARKKRAHKYRADYRKWQRESLVVNAFDEAAGRLEDCVESMRRPNSD